MAQAARRPSQDSKCPGGHSNRWIPLPGHEPKKPSIPPLTFEFLLDFAMLKSEEVLRPIPTLVPAHAQIRGKPEREV